MEKRKRIQLQAADTILRKGVRVPIVSAPFLFRILGCKRLSVVIRQPSMGGLLIISRLVVGMGLTKEEFENMSTVDCHRLIARHGETMLRILAVGVLRYWPVVYLNPMLARWLKWRVEPALLSYAVRLLLELSDVGDFSTTIRYVTERVDYLSPQNQGSQQPAG